MENFKNFIKVIGYFIDSIFYAGAACGSCNKGFEESKQDNVNKELERLWDAYDRSWSSERRSQILDQIKELEKEKL